MTFPVNISIGSVQVSLHAILEVLGVFCAFRYYLYLRRRQVDPISDHNRVSIVIAAAIGSVVGARLIGSFEDPAALWAAPNKLMFVYYNKTIVGGLLGGLFTVEVVKKIIGERTASGDLFCYPLLLSMIIGRVGCFSMGVHENTYGVITNLPWGMDLGDGLMRHPVALYEIIFLLAMWCVLYQGRKRLRLATGASFKIFMICYLLFRLLLDLIKPGVPIIATLTTIQLSCLVGLAWYIRYLINPSLLLTQTNTAYAPEKIRVL